MLTPDRLAQLTERLPNAGPRYTSYPTANHFHAGDFEASYASRWTEAQAPISVYVHVPFCNTVCFYCACNRIHTANRIHAQNYLEHLCAEVRLQSRLTGRRPVTQLHFGGGTPTSFDHAQMATLFAELDRHFELSSSPMRDYSIELDPRKLSAERAAQLAELGFNRISVGVQDFDPDVQTAINRIQSEEETARVIDAARAAGVGSVSVDLIYGLPRQTLEGLARTLEATLRLDPDRISLYHYAHLPQMFKTQRQIDAAQLPSAETRLELFSLAIQTLRANGYRYLGMDHFAKASDPLVRAQDDGSLQRNFMGYSTHGGFDLLGLGVSAIGQVAGLFTQNHKTLNAYYEDIDAGRLPIAKGYRRTDEDTLRAWVIQALMCQLRLDKVAFREAFETDFDKHFAREQAALRALSAEGLLEMSERELRVTSDGRFFIRNLCMIFDAHLGHAPTQHSKTA